MPGKTKTNWIKKTASYFFDIPLATYHSHISGKLLISLEQGRKVMNTSQVNYSFNSLHRVFKSAFKQTQLNTHQIEATLILGLGGGSIVEILRNDLDYAHHIDAVEIDPVVIEIAKTEFEIEKHSPIQLILGDAASFIIQTPNIYGLICVDAFVHDKVPESLLSNNYLDLLISRLSKNGRMYYNLMISHPSYQNKLEMMLEHLQSLQDTTIQSYRLMEMEENNVVLMVTK